MLRWKVGKQHGGKIQTGLDWFGGLNNPPHNERKQPTTTTQQPLLFGGSGVVSWGFGKVNGDTFVYVSKTEQRDTIGGNVVKLRKRDITPPYKPPQPNGFGCLSGSAEYLFNYTFSAKNQNGNGWGLVRVGYGQPTTTTPTNTKRVTPRSYTTPNGKRGVTNPNGFGKGNEQRVKPPQHTQTGNSQPQPLLFGGCKYNLFGLSGVWFGYCFSWFWFGN